MPITPPLTTGFGYGIVLGLGFAFALGMITTTYVLKRYNSEVQTSEMFSTAGRTVKSGLVASAVVSSWTWAATLLQSSGVAYRYGVSGPFWYASGATVQILLFATLAIELKRKAPNAHTFLEIIRARYGVYAHLVFTVFGLMTNVLVRHNRHVKSDCRINAPEGDGYPSDRRLCCCNLPHGHADCGSLFSSTNWRRSVHDCGRDQSDFPHRLRSYGHDFDHRIHLRESLHRADPKPIQFLLILISRHSQVIVVPGL